MSDILIVIGLIAVFVLGLEVGISMGISRMKKVPDIFKDEIKKLKKE